MFARRAWLLCVVVCAGCSAQPLPDALEGPDDPVDAARAYVSSATTRRRALLASIAVADTPYGRLRTEHYSLTGEEGAHSTADWDELPLFAPRVRALRVNDATSDLDLQEGEIADFGPLETLEDWERLGERAFNRLPAQLDLGFAPLRERVPATNAGLRVDADGVVQGAVEAETESGWVVALTCAGCHSALRDGARIAGLSNELIDITAIGIGNWPRGTMDVTRDGVDNPTRPADLRPLVFQNRMHHTGNLANGRIARMVRIETLLTVQYSMAKRPDRRLVAALALYLESLARDLRHPVTSGEAAELFQLSCGECHQGPELAGPVVPRSVVGTDVRATVAGSERSTLGYRAPSLLGSADRRGLLHDGSASDLEALLGIRPSMQSGHPYGRNLSEDSRRLLIDYLRGDSP